MHSRSFGLVNVSFPDHLLSESVSASLSVRLPSRSQANLWYLALFLVGAHPPTCEKRGPLLAVGSPADLLAFGPAPPRQLGGERRFVGDLGDGLEEGQAHEPVKIS